MKIFFDRMARSIPRATYILWPVLCAIVMCSCTKKGDPSGPGSEKKLLSIRIYRTIAPDEIYTGEIDEATKKVKIKSVLSASSFYSVKGMVSTSANVHPDPDTTTTWNISSQFKLTVWAQDGSSVVYTVEIEQIPYFINSVNKTAYFVGDTIEIKGKNFLTKQLTVRLYGDNSADVILLKTVIVNDSVVKGAIGNLEEGLYSVALIADKQTFQWYGTRFPISYKEQGAAIDSAKYYHFTDHEIVIWGKLLKQSATNNINTAQIFLINATDETKTVQLINQGGRQTESTFFSVTAMADSIPSGSYYVEVRLKDKIARDKKTITIP